MAQARTELRIAAAPPYVRVARLTAAGVGAELGMSVDALDEMRLVVDEACAVLLECAVGSADQADNLTVTFRPSGGTLRIRVERPYARIVREPSPMSAMILSALCRRWSLMGGPVLVADIGLGGSHGPDR
jgi:serine/threonine-protein kinase RsbW